MRKTAYKFSEPGEIKTIILYIVKCIGGGADISAITDIFMEYEFVDYFTMRLAIEELRGAGLLEVYREDCDKYMLSDIGKEAMEGFEKNIPLSVRGSIHDTVKEYKMSLTKGEVVAAKYIKHSDFDHEAALSINEGGTDLLKLSLCLGSADDAKKICRNFKKEPQRVYEMLIKTLLQKD